RIISVDSNVQRRTIVTDRVNVSPMSQELLHQSCVSIVSRFRKRRVAQLFARVHIGAFSQQVSNDITSALAGGNKQRRAAVAARVDVRSGEMQQTHAAQASV